MLIYTLCRDKNKLKKKSLGIILYTQIISNTYIRDYVDVYIPLTFNTNYY